MVFVYLILLLFVGLMGLTYWLHRENTLFAQAIKEKMNQKIVERNMERARTSILQTKIADLTRQQENYLKAINQLQNEVTKFMETSETLKDQNQELTKETEALENNLMMAIDEMTDLKIQADKAKRKMQDALTKRPTGSPQIRSELEILKSVSPSLRRKHLTKIRKSISQITGTNQKIDISEIEVIKAKINQARKDLYAIQELVEH